MSPTDPPDIIPPVLFEALARAALTRMQVPSFCRVRRCGRQHFCEGPMAVCEVPDELSGGKDFDVLLPICIARADEYWFAEFLIDWIVCHEDYYGRTVRPPEVLKSLLPLNRHWPEFVRPPECHPSTVPPTSADVTKQQTAMTPSRWKRFARADRPQMRPNAKPG